MKDASKETKAERTKLIAWWSLRYLKNMKGKEWKL